MIGRYLIDHGNEVYVSTRSVSSIEQVSFDSFSPSISKSVLEEFNIVACVIMPLLLVLGSSRVLRALSVFFSVQVIGEAFLELGSFFESGNFKYHYYECRKLSLGGYPDTLMVFHSQEVLVLGASSMIQGVEQTNLVSMVSWRRMEVVLEEDDSSHELLWMLTASICDEEVAIRGLLS
ncbi:hypothetical protein V8G54_032466 [Vigna mungo]|uniref:Uncharacterized protein n=1 Tax=Vigna mungo TaxID=3915 RepID=A0AAQ3RFB9_VIGMU